MYRYVDWEKITKTGEDVATEFIRLAELNSIEAKIIEDRRDKIPQFRTAMCIGYSKEFITDRILELIEKYKEVSKEYPDILPEINKKKNCKYKDVSCLVGIEHNDTIYTIKIENMCFKTFADIRLHIIEQMEDKYSFKLDEMQGYKTYVTGTYNLERL